MSRPLSRLPLLVLAGTVAACSLVSSFADLTVGPTSGDSGQVSFDAGDGGPPLALSDSGEPLDGGDSTDATGADAMTVEPDATTGGVDSGSLTFCQRENHVLCAQFESTTLDNFIALFPSDQNSNGGTHTRSTVVAREGTGSLLTQIPAGVLGFSAAQRKVSVSGYKALTIKFDIFPEKIPIATDVLTLFFIQYGNDTTGQYLTITFDTSGTTLSMQANVSGTSKGYIDAQKAFTVAKWTHVDMSVSISATGTALRLDLTPDGGATTTAINTTLAAATNSMIGTLVTNISPGIHHYNGNAGSPEYKYYFDNLAVDY